MRASVALQPVGEQPAVCSEVLSGATAAAEQVQQVVLPRESMKSLADVLNSEAERSSSGGFAAPTAARRPSRALGRFESRRMSSVTTRRAQLQSENWTSIGGRKSTPKPLFRSSTTKTAVVGVTSRPLVMRAGTRLTDRTLGTRFLCPRLGTAATDANRSARTAVQRQRGACPRNRRAAQPEATFSQPAARASARCWKAGGGDAPATPASGLIFRCRQPGNQRRCTSRRRARAAKPAPPPADRTESPPGRKWGRSAPCQPQRLGTTVECRFDLAPRCPGRRRSRNIEAWATGGCQSFSEA